MTLKARKEGHADLVVLGDGHPVLIGAVKAAIDHSTFLEKCNGETLGLVFEFKLEGPPVTSHRAVYRIEPPNKVVIAISPPMTSL